MTFLQKSTGGESEVPSELPEVQLIVAHGASTDIFVKSGLAFGELSQVVDAAVKILVYQGYLCSATIEVPQGPNPQGLVACRVTTLSHPRNPNLVPLIRLFKPHYKATATLGVHTGKLLHYKLALPIGASIDPRRALKAGPTGVEVRRPGNVMEFWGTQATTYAEVRAEAQRIADLARCMIIGDIYKY